MFAIFTEFFFCTIRKSSCTPATHIKTPWSTGKYTQGNWLHLPKLRVAAVWSCAGIIHTGCKPSSIPTDRAVANRNSLDGPALINSSRGNAICRGKLFRNLLWTSCLTPARGVGGLTFVRSQSHTPNLLIDFSFRGCVFELPSLCLTALRDKRDPTQGPHPSRDPTRGPHPAHFKTTLVVHSNFRFSGCNLNHFATKIGRMVSKLQKITRVPAMLLTLQCIRDYIKQARTNRGVSNGYVASLCKHTYKIGTLHHITHMIGQS